MRNIENRPKELYSIENYEGLTVAPLEIDIDGSIGEFLSNDIFELDGIQPIQADHAVANDGKITVNPSDVSIEMYKKSSVKFQMIFVVVNCYGFKKIDGRYQAKPYSVSLIPATKRGEIEYADPDLIRQFDLERISNTPQLYHGFNPFLGAYGFFMPGNVEYSGVEADMLGFVHNTYALAIPYDHKQVLSPYIDAIAKNAQVNRDYQKYRKDRYYKPFRKAKPRKIWGCDSPIELFLLQALDTYSLRPELQSIICEDGLVVPTFHKLWENQKARRKIKMITEADFYFPDKKLAIFCDSEAHHSSIEAVKKDKLVDEKLKCIGIRSLRIRGKEIANSPISCAERVKAVYDEIA